MFESECVRESKCVVSVHVSVCVWGGRGGGEILIAHIH